MKNRIGVCVLLVCICIFLTSCGISSKIEKAVEEGDYEKLEKIVNENSDDEEAMHTLASLVETNLQLYASGDKTLDEVNYFVTEYYDVGDIDHTESAISAYKKAVTEKETGFAQLLSLFYDLEETIGGFCDETITKYASGAIDYDTAKELVSNSASSNSLSYLNQLSSINESKEAYANGESELLAGEYVSAVDSFYLVSEEDTENYQKALNKIEEAKETFWIDEQSTINDLLSQGQFREAWDSLDDYIEDVQRMDPDADDIFSINLDSFKHIVGDRFDEELQFLVTSAESYLLDSICEMKEQGDYWSIYSLLDSVPQAMVTEKVVSMRHEISAEWFPTLFSVKNISCQAGYINSLNIYADFKNLSEKELKYVYFYFEGYNNVGDREYDFYGAMSSINSNSGDAEYICCNSQGPFKQGEGHTKAQGYRWYKSMCFATRLELGKLRLEYMDGTKITITDKTELAYFLG